MLDIYTAIPAGSKSQTPIVHSAEFLRIELSATHDGKILTSLTATTVDENEPELLDQEVACERLASIDEVLSLIKAHVRIAHPSAQLPLLFH